jgi:hypothetical protein
MRQCNYLVAVLLLGLLPAVASPQVYGDPNSLVNYWYENYLGRAPDPGSAGWVTALNQGQPADTVLAGILGSDEFYARSGSTPQGFVALLYNDILKRPPAAGELNYWVQRMYTSDRAAIADAILTQNPGVWVAPAAAIAPTFPPVVGTPPVVVTPQPGWVRDRRLEWDRHHDIHEYHRPDYHVHWDAHHHR